MVTGDGRPLPSRLALEIDWHRQRLTMVNAMLKEIDEARDAAAEASAVPSIPWFNSKGSDLRLDVLATEVLYREFKNRRSLGSYLGLTPSPFQSGGMDRDQGITKVGNPRARER